MTWTSAGLVTHFAAPPAPETVTIPNVEIVKKGTWASALSGTVPITDDDLNAIVAAGVDPEIDHAPIRFGHIDPRFDGEPASGWLANIRRQGDSIFADITDVPAKLAGVVQSAFRRRSADIAWGVKTPSGRQYKAALAGLALLGVTPPAVKGLADVLARYAGPAPTVDSLIFDDDASPEVAVAVGQFAHLAAGLAAWRDAPATDPDNGAMTDAEIRALFGLAADAPITDQLRAAAPLVKAAQPPAPPTAPAAGVPTVPVPAPGALVAPGAAGGGEATSPPAAATSSPAASGGAGPLSTGATPPAVAPPAPATPATEAPSTAGGPAPTAPTPAAAQVPELVTLSAGNLALLQAQAAAGADAMRVLQEQEREKALLSAVSGGKIAPFEIDRWRELYNAAPEATVKHLSAMSAVFPTQQVGSDGGASLSGSGTPGEWSESDQAAYEATFEHVFGEQSPTARKKGN